MVILTTVVPASTFLHLLGISKGNQKSNYFQRVIHFMELTFNNLKKCAKGWTRENRFFSVSELGGAADAITSQ